MALVLRWLAAFGWTLAIEVPLATVLLPRTTRARRRAVLAVVGQAVTHPAVWFIFPELGLPYGVMLAVAETWAVVAEAAVYWMLGDDVPLGRAVAVSFASNAASFAIWLAILRPLGL